MAGLRRPGGAATASRGTWHGQVLRALPHVRHCLLPCVSTAFVAKFKTVPFLAALRSAVSRCSAHVLEMRRRQSAGRVQLGRGQATGGSAPLQGLHVRVQRIFCLCLSFLFFLTALPDDPDDGQVHGGLFRMLLRSQHGSQGGRAALLAMRRD